MENSDYRRAVISVMMDDEMFRRIEEFFGQNPQIKKTWWYRQAVLEKLEREEELSKI